MLDALRAGCLCLVAALLLLDSAIAQDAKPAAGAPRPPAGEMDWALRLAKEGDLVAYRGVADMNQAGMGAGAMMYPAPSAAGFVAALITHGLLLESVKSSQKTKLQEDADKVLVPYRGVLGAYAARDLMRSGLAHCRAGRNRRAIEAAEGAGADWLVETQPVFSLTQDQRAIILDAVVTLFAPGAPASPAHQVVVRVVSDPGPETEPVTFWTGADGEKLRTESARLLAQSLDIGLAEIAAGPPQGAAVHRTFRYREGGIERMERAQLVAERCGRLTLRTLRGALMSVPASNAPPPDGACGEAAPAKG